MFSSAINLSDVGSIKQSLRVKDLVKDLILIGMGSILIAFCAPLAVKLPFTPVPLAIAPHLCLVLGAVLGKNRGALAVMGYLIQGALGLPVFALGGSGLLHLFGPRGGYLLGYVAGAYITGYLIDKIRHKQGPTDCKTFLSFAAGNGVIYLFGILQLSFFIGFQSAIIFGMLPFVLGDLLKLLIIYKGMKRLSTK